jgi:hypothetical protein
MKTYIYLVTNCYNDPNKVYIGKTKNTRKQKHKLTYGNIEYTILDEIHSLDYKDWEPLETYWIEQFRQWGFELMNKRKKGGSGPNYHTEETKQKISANQERKIKISTNKQRALKISETLSNKLFKRNGPTASKPIYQLDPVTKNIIKEWHNASTAANTLNLNKGNLTQCLKNQRYYKTVGGFAWVYKN